MIAKASSPNGIFPTTLLEISMSVVSRLVSAGTSIWCHCSSPHLITSRPVGSGKTALTLALCKRLRGEYNIGESGVPDLVAP